VIKRIVILILYRFCHAET